MLAERAQDHAFESLIAQPELDGGRWRFREAGDGLSLFASLDGEEVLTVIAGRQVVAQEGLEVLALCCHETFADGQPVEQTIEKVIEHGGLPVLPYGVGKWSGARGKLLNGLLHGALGEQLFLGDNAGRLALSGEPQPFAEARRRDRWILPGTDPLPFAGQASCVGRFGMVLPGPLDGDQPALSIKRLIESSQSQPKPYGRAAPLPGFLWAQTRMQLRKRLRR